jgi:pantothenate kinase-related protein Tda10
MEHDHHVLVADRNPVNGRNTAGHHKLVAAVGGRVRQRGALPQLARREEPLLQRFRGVDGNGGLDVAALVLIVKATINDLNGRDGIRKFAVEQAYELRNDKTALPHRNGNLKTQGIQPCNHDIHPPF